MKRGLRRRHQPLRRDRLPGVHRGRRRGRQDPRVLPVPGARQLLGPQRRRRRVPVARRQRRAGVRAVPPPRVPRRDGRWTDASPRADLDRITRQQDFIRKLASSASAKAGQNPLDALDIANAIVPKLKIDKQLSKDNILRLVKTFRNVDPKQEGALEMLTLPNVGVDVPARSARRAAARGRPAPRPPPDLRRRPDEGRRRRARPTPSSACSTARTRTARPARAIAKLQLRGFGPGEVGNVKPLAAEDARAVRARVRWPRPSSSPATSAASAQLVEDSSISDVDVVLVIGSDWRGVHGKGKTVEAPTHHLDHDGQEDLRDHRQGPEAGRRRCRLLTAALAENAAIVPARRLPRCPRSW